MKLEQIINEMPQVVTVSGGNISNICVRENSESVASIILKLINKRPKWTYKIVHNKVVIYMDSEELGSIKVLYGEFHVQNRRIANAMARKSKIVTASVTRVVRETCKHFYPATAKEIAESASQSCQNMLYRDVPFLSGTQSTISSIMDAIQNRLLDDILEFKPFFASSFSLSDEQLLAYAEEKKRYNRLEKLRRCADITGYQITDVDGKLVVKDNESEVCYFASEVPEHLMQKYVLLKIAEFDHYYLDVGIKRKYKMATVSNDGPEAIVYYIEGKVYE